VVVGQVKPQLGVLLEGHTARGTALEMNGQQLATELLNLRIRLVQLNQLINAGRSPVCPGEDQHELLLPPVFRDAVPVPPDVDDLEIGRRISDLRQ